MLGSLLERLVACPLIVSAQATDGAAVDQPETLWQLAKCSLNQGVQILRLQGVENIRQIKNQTSVPIIGLIKRQYPGSDVYITTTEVEVASLLALGCEVIALDATLRSRPGHPLEELVAQIHAGGALAMGDCDSPESIDLAVAAGCDLVGTTLAGYTGARQMSSGPDFDLLRYAVTTGIPVVAEGRFATRWQVNSALQIGAKAVVVGGAINDPVKQTNALLPSRLSPRTGAVDIGGTWIRFGVFEAGQLVSVEKAERPETREQRLDWIRRQIGRHSVHAVGVGTGGTVNPKTGEVWEAKPIIPGHQGSIFTTETLGVPTVALNDGLATAWGHACHADFAGKRVATLALGTGVGAGFVAEGKIWHGPRGEYPRLNDIMTPIGQTVEELLGGAALSPEPTDLQQDEAIQAFETTVRVFREIVYPEVIVICGSVGLSPWLAPHLKRLGCVASPYGHEAGLYGSMWLTTYSA
jgi:putative N-acetylmannosamine-6-phosphate epimerase